MGLRCQDRRPCTARGRPRSHHLHGAVMKGTSEQDRRCGQADRWHFCRLSTWQQCWLRGMKRSISPFKRTSEFLPLKRPSEAPRALPHAVYPPICPPLHHLAGPCERCSGVRVQLPRCKHRMSNLPLLPTRRVRQWTLTSRTVTCRSIRLEHSSICLPGKSTSAGSFVRTALSLCRNG